MQDNAGDPNSEAHVIPLPDPKVHEPGHITMMKNARSIEEKGLALVGFLYDRLIEKVGEDKDLERQSSVEIEKRSMNIDLFKWVFVRVGAGAFVVVAMVAVVALWKSGDKETAKHIVAALAGIITGWGAKSATS